LLSDTTICLGIIGCGARISHLTLLRRPPTLLLWLGQFVSTAGDWLYLMAAAWMTYKVTGSPAAMSAVAIAAIVPSLIVGFVGGTLLDHWPRLRTLAFIDFARGLLVALLPALYYLHMLQALGARRLRPCPRHVLLVLLARAPGHAARTGPRAR
jgi:MFS family permease